jgi:hypothetical protein
MGRLPSLDGKHTLFGKALPWTMDPDVHCTTVT